MGPKGALDGAHSPDAILARFFFLRVLTHVVQVMLMGQKDFLFLFLFPLKA
jgi:hypothetical protein